MACTAGFMGRPCGRWRDCDYCGRRKRSDQAWCIRENARVRGGEFLLVTVTAPGDDVLPRTGQLCDYGPLSDWCSTMMERWNRVNMAAHNRARRTVKGQRGSLVLASAWQLQKRGAPHIHVAVSAGDAGRVYASAVKEIASDYGFGFSDIAARQGNAVAVARYLSSYLTSEDQRVPSEYLKLLPRRRVYVSRSLQRDSGATMGVAKRVRRLWVFANVDSEIGLPNYTSERQKDWVYYWYRVGLHGYDAVRKPHFIQSSEGIQNDYVAVHGG